MWIVFKSFIENGFNKIMVLAFAAGLFAPGLEGAPKELVLWLLGVVIFLPVPGLR